MSTKLPFSVNLEFLKALGKTVKPPTYMKGSQKQKSLFLEG